VREGKMNYSLLQLATIADRVVSACPSLPILCRFTGRLRPTRRTLCLLPLLRLPCAQDPHGVHQHRHHLGYDCMWLTLDLRLHFPTGNDPDSHLPSLNLRLTQPHSQATPVSFPDYPSLIPRLPQSRSQAIPVSFPGYPSLVPRLS